MRTITREEGPLALYKGAVPALMLCGQGAVQFAVYEWLKARVPKENENVSVEYSVFSHVSCGGTRVGIRVVLLAVRAELGIWLQSALRL